MSPRHCPEDCKVLPVVLLSCRLLVGGAFLIAPFMKLSNPKAFMLAIKSFELVPEALIPFMAYAVPWAELIAGILLVYGLWCRAAAVIAGALFVAFTGALAYVVLAGLPIDCGCFGGLFGNEDVSWTSLVRNAVFLLATGMILWRGGGATSLDAVFSIDPRTSCPAQAPPPGE